LTDEKPDVLLHTTLGIG